MKWLKQIYGVLVLCWIVYSPFFAIISGPSQKAHVAFVVRGIILPVLGYVFFFWIAPGIIAGFRNKR